MLCRPVVHSVILSSHLLHLCIYFPSYLENLPHNPTRKTSFGEFNFDEIRTPSTVSSPLSPPPTPIFTSALLMSRIAKNRPPPSYSAALRQPHHQVSERDGERARKFVLSFSTSSFVSIQNSTFDGIDLLYFRYFQSH